MNSNYEIINGVYHGPEHFKGDLYLRDSQVTSLGNLKTVGGFLHLQNTQVTDLGSLESVGECLDLEGTQVTSLGSLKSVGGWLDLRNSDVTSLGSLKYVDGWLDLQNSKVTDLGSLESVGEKVYLGNDTDLSFQELKDLFNIFNNMPLEDLPLHLNHEYSVIRNLVAKRLESNV